MSPEVQLLLRRHSKISLSMSCCVDSVTMLTDFMTDARSLRLALDMGRAKVFGSTTATSYALRFGVRHHHLK